MKGIIILALLSLAGCGTLVPLEQLEQDALLTGDWSAVEKRERIVARREMKNGPSCPSGQVAVCDVRMSKQRCSCVRSDAIFAILNR